MTSIYLVISIICVCVFLWKITNITKINYFEVRPNLATRD